MKKTLKFKDTPFGLIISEYSESTLAVFAFFVVIMIIAIALFAPALSPQDPYDLSKLDLLDGNLPPMSESFSGSIYYLGTDDMGRDMLSAILYGLRTSLGVGVTSGLLAFAAGTSAGLLAAYKGGKFETLLMRLVDLQLSFPAMLIALVLLVVLGQGVEKIIMALVIVQWAYFARASRGAALAERNKEYLEAARGLRLGPMRIIFRHLLPNIMPSMIVIAAIQIARAITLEATLSFLGIGLPITEPSLGLLISNGYRYMLSGMYWTSFYPGIALVITIVSINLVGDRLRDILNPRLKR
ncbi:MAG: ABC transporter permease [Spirochaetia bacterium]|jgi:peptide/nickel transport system permease protein|nr:ABC transporter permease [Spirochaetia bacterium]